MKKSVVILPLLLTLLISGCRGRGRSSSSISVPTSDGEISSNSSNSNSVDNTAISDTSINSDSSSSDSIESTSEDNGYRYITFNSNGGSGNMSQIKAEIGTWVYMPECSFTPPSGKIFDFWWVDSRKYEAGVTIQVNENYTAYAAYKSSSSEGGGEETSWEDDKTMLECGYYSMGYPSNKEDPVEITTTLSADSSTWFNTEFHADVSDGYRYIYKNSCSDGPSGHKCSVQAYSESHDGGGLKVNDPGTGFGTPMFSHSGAKLEIRIGVSSVNSASQTSQIQKGKDTYHIYYFDKDNNYLGKSVFEEGTIKAGSSPTTELKTYYQESNAKQVAFFEFRCNAVAYKGSQTYNIGIGYCNIKSWERAS